MQAAIADKFTVLRSMRQTAGGHPAGSMQMLSGDPDTRDKPKPKYPDWMTVTNYLRSQEGARTNPLPRYVGIRPPLERTLSQPCDRRRQLSKHPLIWINESEI